MKGVKKEENMSEYTPTEKMNKIFNEKVQLQRWLDVEVALAKAQAHLGVIPQEMADEISRKAKIELLDMEKFKEVQKQVFHPLVSLLSVLRPICQGKAGQYLHLGVTTQDIWDTATVLQLKEAYKVVYESLRQIEADLLSMAEKHADTVMAGRTHCVHAIPLTFGYKIAVLAREVRRHIERLKECRERFLVGHISGAVGTFASFGEKGPQLQALVMKDLGLGVPDICWQASRDRPAEFANLLSIIASTLARFANEVCLLMSSEIVEVSEPWKMGIVGSSTMPHKRNPLIAEIIRAQAKKVKYNAALVTEVMVVEHDRDLNFWIAEGNTLTESCLIMGEILTHSQNMAKGLIVYPERMVKNIDTLKGLMLSEVVMLELGRKVGKQSAFEIVYEDSVKTMEEGVRFKEVLMKDERVTQYLTEGDIDRILDPKGYVGLAPQITREMVNLSRKEREND